MKMAGIICEGAERKDLIGISVKPDSFEERCLCKKIFPKVLQNQVVIRIGELFNEPDNTYFVTPDDYDRVKPLIDRMDLKKEIIFKGIECTGAIVGAVVTYYICEAIKNRFA